MNVEQLPDEHAFGWWFSGPKCIARHGKRRVARAGTAHVIQPHKWQALEVGKFGFHASSSAFDALIHAPDVDDLVAWYVELSGTVIYGTDAMVGGRRRYLARVDADTVLRRYALACLLDVPGFSPDEDNAPVAAIDMLRTPEHSAKKGAIGAGMTLPGKHSHWRLNHMLMAEIKWF